MLGFIEQGGPILWVIFGCGVVAFGVFVERALHLHRARIRTEDFLKGIFNILRRGNIAESLSICDDTPGPVAHIVRTAILHREDPSEAVRSAVADASIAEVSRMERRLVVVATVAQISPLLGLLGTVLGMAETIMIMKGQGALIHLVDVSDGLIRALITTAAGLTVAIPCYVAFNLLVIKIDRIVLDMERAASEIVAFLTTSNGNPEAKGNNAVQ